MRFTMRSCVVSRPLVNTWRTKRRFPSEMTKVSSTRFGSAAGLELHSKVALGKPWEKYCVRMLSRSTATLYSLKGWPSVELKPARTVSLSSCAMPLTSSLAIFHCAPSSMWIATAICPSFP